MTVGPDFSTYSLNELIDSREHIDREVYPDRYAEILKHIETRRQQIESELPGSEPHALKLETQTKDHSASK